MHLLRAIPYQGEQEGPQHGGELAENVKETKEFIEHIRSCKDCWEELEIYYVMLIGLKQLDEGEELAADFKEKLQNEVDSRYLEIEKNSKRKYAVKIVIVLTIAAMLIWMFVYLVFAMFL